MNRVGYILSAFSVWTVSSGLLLFICIFSINQTIITAALVIAAVTLVGSAVAFVTKHDKIGLVVAALPAVVIVALLAMLAVVGYSDYHR
jgi:hypothetical protein